MTKVQWPIGNGGLVTVTDNGYRQFLRKKNTQKKISRTGIISKKIGEKDNQKL